MGTLRLQPTCTSRSRDPTARGGGWTVSGRPRGGFRVGSWRSRLEASRGRQVHRSTAARVHFRVCTVLLLLLPEGQRPSLIWTIKWLWVRFNSAFENYSLSLSLSYSSWVHVSITERAVDGAVKSRVSVGSEWAETGQTDHVSRIVHDKIIIPRVFHRKGGWWVRWGRSYRATTLAI